MGRSQAACFPPTGQLRVIASDRKQLMELSVDFDDETLQKEVQSWNRSCEIAEHEILRLDDEKLCAKFNVASQSTEGLRFTVTVRPPGGSPRPPAPHRWVVGCTCPFVRTVPGEICKHAGGVLLALRAEECRRVGAPVPLLALEQGTTEGARPPTSGDTPGVGGAARGRTAIQDGGGPQRATRQLGAAPPSEPDKPKKAVVFEDKATDGLDAETIRDLRRRASEAKARREGSRERVPPSAPANVGTTAAVKPIPPPSTDGARYDAPAHGREGHSERARSPCPERYVDCPSVGLYVRRARHTGRSDRGVG